MCLQIPIEDLTKQHVQSIIFMYDLDSHILQLDKEFLENILGQKLEGCITEHATSWQVSKQDEICIITLFMCSCFVFEPVTCSPPDLT